MDWKTSLNRDVGNKSREQNDAFIEPTNLTSLQKETGKKFSKITGRAGLETDIEEAEGEIFLLIDFFN